MSNFKKIVPFIYPYKRYAFLNIFFNVLYALFSTLSFVALIPMLQVLFDKNKQITVKPVFHGILKIQEYGENYLSYYITTTKGTHEPGYVLSIMVAIIISIIIDKT
jgi:subfamily B ATP-binding cassette protein MsbA